MENIIEGSTDNLRKLLIKYHEVEQDLITTRPTLCEVDEENYSDSYKWLPLQIPDELQEIPEDMILSDIEQFPNDCLAGILLAILKNQVPNGIRLNGLGIDRVGTSFRFCISGSTSLEALQIACEQFELNRDLVDEKKNEK